MEKKTGKTTGDLQEELMSQPNLNEYMKANSSDFRSMNVAELLLELYQSKAVSKAELARRAGMSEVYLHQVFSGRRKPSRDRLLCICIGMGATMEETQQMLKQASYAQIYPRIRREAIIGHGLIHGTSLDQINDILFAENEKTLF